MKRMRKSTVFKSNLLFERSRLKARRKKGEDYVVKVAVTRRANDLQSCYKKPTERKKPWRMGELEPR